MQLIKVQNLSPIQYQQIVDLHNNNLPESFINNFGKKFLLISYQTIFKSSNNICFILNDHNKKIIGFLVGTFDGNKFNQDVIKSNFFKLTMEILKNCLFRPTTLVNLIIWGVIPTPSNKTKPELQFIVISPQYQGKGWGKKMIIKLGAEFKKSGVQQYRVGTKATNKLSNIFYKKMGFQFIYTTTFFGDKFNYYLSPKIY